MNLEFVFIHILYSFLFNFVQWRGNKNWMHSFRVRTRVCIFLMRYDLKLFVPEWKINNVQVVQGNNLNDSRDNLQGWIVHVFSLTKTNIHP